MHMFGQECLRCCQRNSKSRNMSNLQSLDTFQGTRCMCLVKIVHNKLHRIAEFLKESVESFHTTATGVSLPYTKLFFPSQGM